MRGRARVEIRNTAVPGKVTLIIFSGEMDKALAAFNIAVGFAAGFLFYFLI